MITNKITSNNKQKATDSIITNLKTTDDAKLNGNFIHNTDDTGSFQSINTPINGIEVDVDDL